MQTLPTSLIGCWCASHQTLGAPLQDTSNYTHQPPSLLHRKKAYHRPASPFSTEPPKRLPQFHSKSSLQVLHGCICVKCPARKLGFQCPACSSSSERVVSGHRLSRIRTACPSHTCKGAGRAPYNDSDDLQPASLQRKSDFHFSRPMIQVQVVHDGFKASPCRACSSPCRRACWSKIRSTFGILGSWRHR